MTLLKCISQKSNFTIISAWHIIDYFLKFQNEYDSRKKMIKLFDSTFNEDSLETEEMRTVSQYLRDEINRIFDEYTISREYF